jgi:hypothetical protein
MLKAMRARTLLRFLFLPILFSCIQSLASAATEVTGDIATSTRWTLGGSPYVVNFPNEPYFPHFLTISPGATLTIGPGVVVKFGAYNGLAINGTLIAIGTAASPITFT